MIQSGLVRLDALSPWPDNPRTNDAAVGPVAASIERFGFLAPIVALPDGTIVAGHTRHAAALRLGLEVAPVAVVSLSHKDARSYAIADNRMAELGSWDEKLLALLVSGLPDGLGEVAGLSPGVLAELVAVAEELGGSEPDVPLPRAPTSKTLTVKYSSEEFVAVEAMFAEARKKLGVFDNASALAAAARRLS